MIFIRLIGALLLALSGFFGARIVNDRVSLALAQTEGFIAFIRMVRLRIDCFSMPIGEILSACDTRIYRACGYFENLPPGITELAEGCKVYDAEAHAVFFEFASEFGKGYRDEQMRACDYYSALLEERRRILAAVLPQKKKRNSTLILSGALAAAVLLI